MPPGLTTRNDRRTERSNAFIPTDIEVQSGNGVVWRESAESRDVSSSGVAIVLSRPMTVGRVVLLSLSMPPELRLYDQDAPKYEVRGVVRHCIRRDGPNPGGAQYATGVALIGKEAPDRHELHPAKLYDVAWANTRSGFWQPVEMKTNAGDQVEQRRETRFPVPERVVIQLLDENSDPVAEEPTVTENISARGAVVFSGFDAEPGTFLRVISEHHGVEIISIIRARREDPTGISHLHIEFIDRLFPLEGVI